MSGKQNFAWYRFDHRHLAGPNLSACAWFGVGVVARQLMCAMRCTLSPAAIQFQVLWRMLAGSVLTWRFTIVRLKK